MKALSPGETLGRYRILARLRAGGMATLYLGQRTGAAGFTRPVAIKVIHPHLAENRRFVEMFVDEARLSAKLDDPHIVHVEELGEAEGTYFLVMEYVDGVSLAQLLRDLARRKRGLSIEVATWIAIQIAAGLHAAHEATDERGYPMRLVHRDVSPHNVLLAFKGHVKLIDFGVAKAIGVTKDTNTGSLRGKIAYMPPEQAYGRSVDRRADVYALGIVLWEMLTMRRLFQADNDLALLDMVRKPRIVPPSAFVPGMPPALDAVIMRALAAEPALRPPTADDLATQLGAAVPGTVGLGARDVAKMLAAIMPDAIADSRRKLTEALGSTARLDSETPPDPNAQEALATMTIEAQEATILFEDDRLSASPAPVVQAAPATTAPKRITPRQRTYARILGMILGTLLAFLGVGTSVLIARWVMTSPKVPLPLPGASAASVEPAPASPPPSAEGTVIGVSPPPVATPSATTLPAPSATIATRPKTAPRATHTSSPPAPSSSVQMHGGVPIFDKPL